MYTVNNIIYYFGSVSTVINPNHYRNTFIIGSVIYYS